MGSQFFVAKAMKKKICFWLPAGWLDMWVKKLDPGRGLHLIEDISLVILQVEWSL